jgi:hypothetical protein
VVKSNPVPPCSPAISPKTSACSATLASEPWNSSSRQRRLRQRQLRIGVHRPDLQRVEKLDPRHRHTVLDHRDHRVAGGLTDGKEQVAAEIASGTPCSFSVSSVMIPSVPSEPTISRVRS